KFVTNANVKATDTILG
nr:S-layer protein=26 kda CNBr peptide [Aeromonas hydrophila, TF7, Peptide Partial, 16 aa] [Aeromonas hydrophila]